MNLIVAKAAGADILRETGHRFQSTDVEFTVPGFDVIQFHDQARLSNTTELFAKVLPARHATAFPAQMS